MCKVTFDEEECRSERAISGAPKGKAREGRALPPLDTLLITKDET